MLTEKQIKDIYYSVLSSDTEDLVAEAISLTEQAVIEEVLKEIDKMEDNEYRDYDLEDLEKLLKSKLKQKGSE